MPEWLRKGLCLVLPILPVLVAVRSAGAEEPASESVPEKAETIVITASPLTSASSSTASADEFMLQPHPEPADILMAATPGLFVERHAGGEKANIWLLRGFNADHGSDVAIFVDGMPVNLVSHAHSQGYADLYWLIPEVIEHIEFNKGTYSARFGDFDTAGAINLITRDSFEDSSFSASGGMFNSYRGLLVASPKIEGWKPFVAVELFGTDGPFQNGEGLRRYNVFSKVTHDFSAHTSLSLALTTYGARWNASGLIPQRAVNAGALDRFGAIDPAEGGDSQRQSVFATLRTRGDNDEFNLLAYYLHSSLELYSDFTFFADDPFHGDEIEQDDRRSVLGLKTSYHFHRSWSGIAFETTFGAEFRTDLIDNQLRHDQQRQRLSTQVDDGVSEVSLALFGEEDIVWTSWLRSVIGLRADYFSFDVEAHPTDNPDPTANQSGVRQAAMVSPKASLVFTPIENTELFLNFGLGYHSNDARGVVRKTGAVTPLTRAIGYEAGARTRLFDRLDLSADFYVVELASEMVWEGDAGTTEAEGPTRRYGVEAAARLEILPWLVADAEVNWSQAIFTNLPGSANAVPLSPTWVVTGGLSARHPSGVFGRLGVSYLGDRPGDEDQFITVPGFIRFDLTAGYRWHWLEASITVQNLLNTGWREAQEVFVSRLPTEIGPDCPAGTRADVAGGAFKGCEDIHFAPGAPINFQATLSAHF